MVDAKMDASGMFRPSATCDGAVYVLYKSGSASKFYVRFLSPDTDANDGSKISFVTSL